MSTSAIEQRAGSPGPVIDEAARVRPRGARLDPWLIAVLATAISAGWAARPSLWFDEGATISASANRTLPELWKLLGHIDAVHGLYYLLMHGWFAYFPRRSSGRGCPAASPSVVRQPVSWFSPGSSPGGPPL